MCQWSHLEIVQGCDMVQICERVFGQDQTSQTCQICQGWWQLCQFVVLCIQGLRRISDNWDASRKLLTISKIRTSVRFTRRFALIVRKVCTFHQYYESFKRVSGRILSGNLLDIDLEITVSKSNLPSCDPFLLSLGSVLTQIISWVSAWALWSTATHPWDYVPRYTTSSDGGQVYRSREQY